ncbi:NADP-dependent oxidoreductase [Ketobacter sp.]|uniref:NADP-dependent oxidoreductase n=1 Tax=Ketobacter sp. TaxID=2083498 RepID=UPI0025C163DC|nr:NADP-dependent oxidoreductase [Ketobacter sp.]
MIKTCSSGADMQALYYSRFGAADTLTLGALPMPEPAPGEVLVRVAAAGLNPIDVKTRAGKGFVAAQLGTAFRFVPGYDLAGEVASQHPDWPAGTAVVGMVNFPLRGGACAEYCAVEAGVLVAAPRRIPLADAAGLPLAGLTAWQGLFQHGALTSGQRLLVLAGAGGVGHLAVQLGRWAGAEVAATASKGNLALLGELGAHHCLDYGQPDVLEAAGPWDLILDLMGGDVGLQALDCLAPEGLLLTVPTLTAATLEAAGAARQRRVRGYTVQPDAAQLEQLVALVDRGDVTLHISQRFPLAQGAEAHRLVEGGHVQGKVILEMPAAAV